MGCLLCVWMCCMVWMCLSDVIFRRRHGLCFVGCFVWWGVLFGGMLCLVGCFVWLGALFGWKLCMDWEVFSLLVRFVCLVGQFCGLVWGVLCTGVDVFVRGVFSVWCNVFVLRGMCLLVGVVFVYVCIFVCVC